MSVLTAVRVMLVSIILFPLSLLGDCLAEGEFRLSPLGTLDGFEDQLPLISESSVMEEQFFVLLNSYYKSEIGKVDLWLVGVNKNSWSLEYKKITPNMFSVSSSKFAVGNIEDNGSSESIIFANSIDGKWWLYKRGEWLSLEFDGMRKYTSLQEFSFDEHGNLYIIGYTESGSAVDYYDHRLNPLWSQSFGGKAISNISISSNGIAFFTKTLSAVGGESYAGTVVVLDRNGSVDFVRDTIDEVLEIGLLDDSVWILKSVGEAVVESRTYAFDGSESNHVAKQCRLFGLGDAKHGSTGGIFLFMPEPGKVFSRLSRSTFSSNISDGECSCVSLDESKQYLPRISFNSSAVFSGWVQALDEKTLTLELIEVAPQ